MLYEVYIHQINIILKTQALKNTVWENNRSIFMYTLPSLQKPILPNDSDRSHTKCFSMLCQFCQTGENKPEVNFRERARNKHTLNHDLDSSVTLFSIPCRHPASTQGKFTQSLCYRVNLPFPVPKRGCAYPTQHRD